VIASPASRDVPAGDRALRLLGPLSGPLGGRMERRIWTGLKHQLEDDARAHPA
jgi:hypothetical protein